MCLGCTENLNDRWSMESEHAEAIMAVQLIGSSQAENPALTEHLDTRLIRKLG